MLILSMSPIVCGMYLYSILLATLSMNLNIHLWSVPQQPRGTVTSYLGVRSFSSLEQWHGRNKGRTTAFATWLPLCSFGRTRGPRWGHWGKSAKGWPGALWGARWSFWSHFGGCWLEISLLDSWLTRVCKKNRPKQVAQYKKLYWKTVTKTNSPRVLSTTRCQTPC